MSESIPFIKFKQIRQGATLMFMHPQIVMIMFEMALWCFTRSIDFVVTDTISTLKKDLKLGRKSNSHRTKRAFDLRSRCFSIKQKEDFITYFNTKYVRIASISSSDGVARLIVEHGEGDNKHFHIALHSRFRINF